MTTAEAIEGMTDPGEFEILATRVLRITDEDCRLLEHVGVNAAGKTIANPIDSFCRVPGINPPRFVMAAFTTDKVESLERKWLFDHSTATNAKKATAADDGDLIKASRRAEALRKDYPNATFVLHLCTNKQPDHKLLDKVNKRGQDLGLEVRFLARSRLRDTLDVTSDGQWLRKEHLGIQAERLSLPLFRELSAKSLQQYGREFLITFPEAFVPTSSERALEASLASSRSIYVVTGPSGSGKSVSCYQILHNHLTQGGVGLWIPGEIATRATSLEEAICLTLRSLLPIIEPTAGAVALRLGSSSQRLVVVVDDINRGGSPGESLRKLLAWSRPSRDENNSSSSPCAILVPAWDLFWAPLEQQFRSTSWLERVPVKKMEEDEALACLAAALGTHIQRFAEADQRQTVAALGYDPILIALYAASVTDHGELHLPTLAIDVVTSFVETAEAEAATSVGHLQSEYDSALSHLAGQMLNKRNLYPSWDDVRQWLPPNDVSAIRELARLEKVCQVTSRGGENRFEFRHDRILEHFLVRALQPMLSNPESNADVLVDPFYASFVGQALALNQPSDELLRWVQQNAPLALISSLRFLPALPNDTADRLAAAATRWLESASKDQHDPPSVLLEAYRLLKETDTPYLLIVTQSLGQHRLLAHARLANGDAVAEIREFSRRFDPAVNNHDLDMVLSRALHRHKQRLVADCAAILQRPDLAEADRYGALVLAGFIGDTSLAVPVRTAWELAAEKSNVLLPALWAGLRCATSDPTSVLDEMMEAWAALPHDNRGNGLSERAAIARELKRAIPRGISEPVLNYVIAKAKTDETLRWPITVVLEHLDQPLVVTFLIEEAAEIKRRREGTKRFSPWPSILEDNWGPTSETRGKRLPTESVQAMRSCWESKTVDPQLRETAFEFWARTVDDLDVLRSIPADHPQFKSVLLRRARLGDLSAIPLIKPLIATDQHWFHVISKIWTEQFRDVLDDALLNLEKHTPTDTDYANGATDVHDMSAELLRDIPANEAQPLLIKHWGHLKFSRLFVQTALYIGSPECVALATKAIESYPANMDPFKYLDDFFGFSVTGLMDRVESRHLEVILPYLIKLSDHTLSAMVDFCERRGYCEWGRRHLKPEFDRRRARLPKVAKESQELIERVGRHHLPSDNDLLEELDWIEKQGDSYYGPLYYWSEKFEERQDGHVRWRRILDEWLSRNPTAERFRLFAEAILQLGIRSDIDLLYKHMILGDPNEIEQLRANAKFGIMRRILR